MKIVIAGGTGFIGQYLQKKYIALGYEVIIVSRKKNHLQWNDTESLISALNNASLLINLAGKSVDCRYTEENKSEILRSRIETTQLLGSAISNCKTPPQLWINSSTATIYRHADDRPMTETTGEIGAGFSVSVAQAWEKAFFDFKLENTRQIALRISIVLGKGGGVINPLKNIVRFGLGGKQGNGKQMFSWIHIEDLYRIIEFIRNNTSATQIYNCAAPNPVTNTVLMQTLRKQMKMPVGLPSPKWLLEMGAKIINTETELVLKSRWVLPDNLQKEGFSFTYPTIDDCLREIIS